MKKRHETIAEYQARLEHIKQGIAYLKSLTPYSTLYYTVKRTAPSSKSIAIFAIKNDLLVNITFHVAQVLNKNLNTKDNTMKVNHFDSWEQALSIKIHDKLNIFTKHEI